MPIFRPFRFRSRARSCPSKLVPTRNVSGLGSRCFGLPLPTREVADQAANINKKDQNTKNENEKERKKKREKERERERETEKQRKREREKEIKKDITQSRRAEHSISHARAIDAHFARARQMPHADLNSNVEACLRIFALAKKCVGPNPATRNRARDHLMSARSTVRCSAN